MADFTQAVRELIDVWEGGESDNVADIGGETKFGISKRSYPNVDVGSLTREQAEDIYRRDFWHYDNVASQPLANKLLSLSVNVGVAEAVTLLQRSLAYVTGKDVTCDGIWGKQTETLVSIVDEDALAKELSARVAAFYALTILRRPANAVFVLGWMRRAVG
jgi:lysozyme family protein